MNEIMQGEPSVLKDCEVVSVGLKERLIRKKQKAELELAQINAAIESLEADPEVERLLTLVGKAVNIRW